MPYAHQQIVALKDERTNDPLAIGYAGMSDAQFLASVTADRKAESPLSKAVAAMR